MASVNQHPNQRKSVQTEAAALASFRNIPQVLRDRRQWLCWKLELKQKKFTKIPVDPNTGRPASVRDPETWTSFEKAIEAFQRHQFRGIGFVFTAEDPYCGVDIDKCRNPEDGTIDEPALQLVAALNSYSELSPSGSGIHIIVEARMPTGGNRRGGLELYDQGRYFTVTGQHLEGTPTEIRQRQRELEEIHSRTFVTKGKATGVADKRPPVLLADEQLIHRATISLNEKFLRLWRGDTSEYGADASRADMALCGMLAHCTQGDPEWIDRLFRRSGLFRSKWDERRGNSTYGALTINRVLEDFGRSRPTSSASLEREWPAPPNEKAFHGLAGEIVRAIEPHSEADPLAILFQFLVGIGSLIGRRAYFRVEADKHFTNLFAVLVGASSKARKGTSWAYIREILGRVDEVWLRRVRGGLSTGEGLIDHVRDPIQERQPIRENRRIIRHDMIEVDPGESDKRLLLVESEFGRVLQVAARETNTLSAVLRDAWDATHELRVMTKNARLSATGAHISLIGHITGDELRRLLSDTMAANGYGNRHLWVCTKRSKLLPEGGNFSQIDVDGFVRRLREIRQWAEKDRELRRDERARKLWTEVYRKLSADRRGLLGALTNRAEAQVMRLALVFAVLDCSDCIGEAHLLAALSCWSYCFSSARYIFGEALGDATADQILAALRSSSKGLSRTEIRDRFARNKPGQEISRALGLLAECGMAEESKSGNTGGRSSEVWMATRTGLSLNDYTTETT